MITGYTDAENSLKIKWFPLTDYGSRMMYTEVPARWVCKCGHMMDAPPIVANPSHVNPNITTMLGPNLVDDGARKNTPQWEHNKRIDAQNFKLKGKL